MSRDDLALEHATHVRAIAKRMAYNVSHRVDADDLEQDGLLAILEMTNAPATDQPGARELVVARVYGALKDSMRDADPCSRQTRRRAKAIALAEHEIEQAYGHAGPNQDIAKTAGLSLDQYFEVLAAVHMAVPRAFEITESETIDAVYLAQTGAQEGEDPCDALARKQLAAFWTHTVATLPARWRYVLSQRVVGRSLAEIGAELGVVESRISQILSDIVRYMRSALEARGFI